MQVDLFKLFMRVMPYLASVFCALALILVLPVQLLQIQPLMLPLQEHEHHLQHTDTLRQVRLVHHHHEHAHQHADHLLDLEPGLPDRLMAQLIIWVFELFWLATLVFLSLVLISGLALKSKLLAARSPPLPIGILLQLRTVILLN